MRVPTCGFIIFLQMQLLSRTSLPQSFCRLWYSAIEVLQALTALFVTGVMILFSLLWALVFKLRFVSHSHAHTHTTLKATLLADGLIFWHPVRCWWCLHLCQHFCLLFQESVDIYMQAINNLPLDYSPQSLYNMLGQTLTAMGNFQDAEKWYNKALKAKPDHVPAHLTLADLHAKTVSSHGIPRMM